MCGQQRKSQMEGIRFLDEQPTPTGPAPSPIATPKQKKRRERPVGLLTFLAVVGVGIAMKWGGGAGDTEAKAIIEDRFDVEAAPRIEVESFDGAVRVERGESDTVSYRIETSARGQTLEEAERALRLIRPTVEGGPDSVRVRIEHGEAPQGWSGRAEIRLEVPADSQVRIVSRNGLVRVEEVLGSVAARTTNGRIEVEDASGPIVLQTSNGSIDCEATDAQLSAETSNGAITFHGSLAPGTSRLVTSNGSVNLQLPEHGRFQIDAESRNGRIESDFPIEGEGDRTLRVSSTDDEPATRVEIRTTNGAIRVEKD